MPSSRHAKSYSYPHTHSPLSYPDRLVRISSLRRRLEASTSTSTSFQPEIVLETDPFIPVSIPPDLSYLPPKVLDILSKGVDMQSSLLFQQIESYHIPKTGSEYPKSEADLKVELRQLKPTDFISSVIYTFPSTSKKP